MKITSIGEILFDVYPDEKRLGGAPFNFFYHLFKITGNANFVSRIGNDNNGRKILEFLHSKNIGVDYLQVDEKHPTGTVEIKLNDEKVPEFNIVSGAAYEYIELSRNLNDLIRGGTEILYHGTLAQKGEITSRTMDEIFKRDVARLCDLNLRQHYYSEHLLEKNLRGCRVVKINRDELDIISEYFSIDADTTEERGKKLMDKFGIEMLCVTLGPDGAVVIKDGEIDRRKATAENIVDTVGAGDAYAAILCIGFAGGWEVSRINRTAVEFAAAACSYQGALPGDDAFYDGFKETLNGKQDE